MIKRLPIWILSVFICAVALAPALAQDGKLKKEELDQLLAPIALYPDDLLTNVLMASTYPLDVVQAARWRKEPPNAKLKGDTLAKALEAKDWDPSVKALVQFPNVLQTMSEKLDWTQKLGDAFLGQQDEVMDEIQLLRAKADAAGNLKSNTQQKVIKEAGGDARPIYVIEPTATETVYVPVYQPSVVYGSWWYPAYPPYYWSYPGAAFVNGFFWGAGVAVAASIWDWNHIDWHRRDIDIDVNKWNSINVNKARITSKKWEHRADHRGPVPYKNKAVRDKFAKADRTSGSKDFRGHDRGDIDRADVEKRLQDKSGSRDKGDVRDRAGDKAGDRAKGDVRDRVGDKAGDRTKGDARDRVSDKAGDRVGDRAKGKVPDKVAQRDVKRPAAKKPSPGAFDVKRGADVRSHAARGHASRKSMSAGRGSAPRGRAGGRRR